MIAQSNLLWIVLYLAAMTVMTCAMLYARDAAKATFGTEQAKEQWRQDRDALLKNAEEGPVRRRAMPAEERPHEPPALRLMRDYFGRTLAILWLLGSALFFVFMITIRGALGWSPPTRVGDRDTNS